MTLISGATWIAIGIFLLQMGVHLLFVQIFDIKSSTPLINLFRGIFSHQESAILITSVALYVGFLKGKHILTLTANRTITHIRSLPNPACISQMYSKKYFILLAIMVSLGISIKYLGVPNDVRGAVDIAIGTGLIQGAMHYFKIGFQLRSSAL